MNATLPLRSNRSGCATARTAMLQLDSGFLRRSDERTERALRHLDRVVVGPALDHDADLNCQIAAVTRAPQASEIARIIEVTFARHEKLVVRTATTLVFQIGVDRVRR